MTTRDATPQPSPGPWLIDEDDRPQMEWNRHIYGADGLAVCFMAHSNGKANGRDVANASLVAAAPDLLRALETAATYIFQLYHPNPEAAEQTPYMQQIRAAIKKARGE